MNILHQLGHNFNWNFSVYDEDEVGDGFILSPINMQMDKINKLNIDYKIKSFFDPQFYLMSDTKGSLKTYSFFPGNLINGFNSSDFSNYGSEILTNCIEFQNKNDFKYIVIPWRFSSTFNSDSLNKIKNQIIEPFVNIYKNLKIEKKILLTVIVNQHNLLDESDRNLYLNFLTSIKDIDGIYLIFNNEYSTKQLKDTNYLINALKFIYYLKFNNFEVHIGYNNTEGLLYSLANPNSISMGSYENLRRFNVKRFETQENKEQRGPIPRIYIPKLFQWIDYGYIYSLKELYDKFDLIIDKNKYQIEMFDATFNWHFSKPQIYKHYFTEFYKQCKLLPNDISERIDYLHDNLIKAINLFEEIQNAGVLLDSGSDGSHLSIWVTTINMFKKFRKEQL